MSTNPNSEDFDFSAFEEDEKLEWWQPSKRDQYDLTNKLFRVGCRPLQRKYVACKQQGESDFQKCKVILISASFY